jgi:hypothetical protein
MVPVRRSCPLVTATIDPDENSPKYVCDTNTHIAVRFGSREFGLKITTDYIFINLL